MQEKTQKILLAAIVIIIASYLGIGLVMRDKSPTWCNLSLGTYDIQNSVPVRDDFGFTNNRKVYGCEGGFFGFLD